MKQFLSAVYFLGIVVTTNNIAFAKTLQVGGIDYPHSCGKPEINVFKKSVNEIAGRERSPDQAWRLVDTLFCKKAEPSHLNYLIKFMAPKVSTSSFGTGEGGESVVEKAPSRDLALSAMNQGEAWGTQVSKSGEEIEISYRPNEVCVSGVTLRFTGKAWTLAGIRSACD